MKKSTKIAIALIVIAVAAYISINLYIKQSDKVETEYAEPVSAYQTVEANCFVIRDEMRGSKKNNSALIKNSGDGVYVPYIEDGARVAAGDTIALFFSSQSEAKAYKEKIELEEKLESYERLRNQSMLNFIDIDRLDTTIEDGIIGVIESIENKNFSQIDEKFDTLKYNISSRQIATGENVDFKTQIENIEEELKSLSGSGINYKKIKADFSGCFISSVDGYESAVDYDKVEDMSIEEIESALEVSPTKVKDNVIGKLVDEYNWYAVCTVPMKLIGELSVGSQVKASFEDTNVSGVSMTVMSIESDGENVGLVLKCGLMSSDIANLRKEKIILTLEEHSGLKVPKEAVRMEKVTKKDKDGNEVEVDMMGVYVLIGQVVRFRQISEIYSTEDFVVSEMNSGSKTYVSLYDMIITNGRELYDGKIVY